MSGEPSQPEGFTPMPAFRIEAADAPDGMALVVMSGELDLATSGRFRSHVEDAVERRVRALVADVAEVTFMDSTMLRELLRAHKSLAAAGGRFVVAAPGASVRRLLELTATDGVLETAPDRDAAFASLSGR